MKTKTISKKYKDQKDIELNTFEMVEKINEIPFIIKRVSNEQFTRYIIAEDASKSQSLNMAFQLQMIESFKSRMPEEDYKRAIMRIRYIKEDGFEEVILSSKLEIIGFVKTYNTFEQKVDGDKKFQSSTEYKRLR